MKHFDSLEGAVRDLCGNERRIEARQRVFGGDINEACALRLDDGTVLFMKSNSPGFLENFEAEAEGLEAIRRTRAIGVPEVFGTGTDSGFSFLLMEYIREGSRIGKFWETLAQELAAMHRADAGMLYGFSRDNWIGAGRQINTFHDSWISFYRDCRLQPQFEAAAGYFSESDRKRIGTLLSGLDRYLTEPSGPSLIHGDLWAGNMITGNDGRGWLIDPAVYCGHPEADIAMTQLFGGFPDRFYAAYADTGMMQPGYGDRRDLYNLYHLLNHLNMFGSGYLGSVKRILAKYT